MHRFEKWFGIDSEIFRMHRDSSGIDSEFSFGAACFRNSRTLLVSKSLHILEPKIIIHKFGKGWSDLQESSQWAVFTLISHHKSILSRGEITDSAEHTSALLHEHLSVQIKTRLERHMLLNSWFRIDSRGIAMHSENLRIDPKSIQNRCIVPALLVMFPFLNSFCCVAGALSCWKMPLSSENTIAMTWSATIFG